MRRNQRQEAKNRQAIGGLLYLTSGTRPDMAYSSTHMCQFNEKHTQEHWWGVKHISRYLKGTRQRKLKFRKKGEPLQIYSDADWGGDRTDRKSYSGYIVLLVGASISCSSKKQPTTASSSTEAGYVAMCHTAKESLWINNLLKEICSELVSPTHTQKVLVDNQGAIVIAKKPCDFRKKQTHRHQIFLFKRLGEGEKHCVCVYTIK
ncbi:Copia protein [Araneus ventricosus]|uniref:Copia protein n=1 Tax=Araneus ventricosus TaxID=182803 RepID=A0A4Y2KAG3_ARAVE|nr:Copia protein [Araneus ventricosus]